MEKHGARTPIAQTYSRYLCLAALPLFCVAAAKGAESQLQQALSRAGDNGPALRVALANISEPQIVGLRFLIENMPQEDLESLSAEFLVEHTNYAYRAWREAPWLPKVDEATFLNYILPYASVNERRDAWRRPFHERFSPLVRDTETRSEAAALLNNRFFAELNVKYSTRRAKADQSPFESIESGLAACTGLSILLIDVCRAVGIPARFVGTPLWTDRSGNHSWVEVWDKDWHFTGAAEPTGMKLNEGWFKDRAALARRNNPLHAIYATSFRRTPLRFPCVWNMSVDYVSATNVTDRYQADGELLPDDHGFVRIRAMDSTSAARRTCDVKVYAESGEVLFTGKTRDERFDSNDHLSTALPLGRRYRVVAACGPDVVQSEFELAEQQQLVTLRMPPRSQQSDATPADSQSTDPIAQLEEYVSIPHADRPPLAEQPFARQPLTKSQAKDAERFLWEDHVRHIRAARAEEMASRVLKYNGVEMPFAFKTFGEQPSAGWSLFISLHGGGGAPERINTRQWKNQQTLYEPTEGIYLAPRAPTDTWDLWHKSHIDHLFTRLIENLVVLEDVNPNRVYLLGYSAGGDGVYQLAPRMADRWAAAAMMAGHPNDASPLGLRNIGFAIYMGGKDAAYNRNSVAAEWQAKLAALRENDPLAYRHLVTIYPEKGHWMDGEDASALEWMTSFVRDPLPEKIVWKQDDVTNDRFYWLSTPERQPVAGALVTATRSAQTIEIEGNGIDRISVRLNDQMLDLDQEICIKTPERILYEGQVERTIAMLAATLAQRGDPQSVFSAEVVCDLSKSHAASVAAVWGH